MADRAVKIQLSPELPQDGRQSEIAAATAQGVQRLLRAHGIDSLCEFSLGNGRRADVLGIGADGTISIVEIKSSLVDFRADNKWPDYLDYCDLFFFAAPLDFDISVFPDDTGLILADAYWGEYSRQPARRKLNGARRRAVLLSFARQAARRLHTLYDPDSTISG